MRSRVCWCQRIFELTSNLDCIVLKDNCFVNGGMLGDNWRGDSDSMGWGSFRGRGQRFGSEIGGSGKSLSIENPAPSEVRLNVLSKGDVNGTIGSWLGSRSDSDASCISSWVGFMSVRWTCSFPNGSSSETESASTKGKE